MKFDNIIIGGGVAGLTCAIRCAQAGLKTAVIAAGQSALHFSSGSIDVLSRLPTGAVTHYPFNEFETLANQSPDHPYSKLGVDVTHQAIDWYQQTMKNIGIELHHQPDDCNHLRITPMGTFKATWLSQSTVHPFPMFEPAKALHKIALVTIDGFRDFQPQLAADNLRLLPQFANVEITTAAVALPNVELMQRNPCEYRSIDISRVLADDNKLQRFASAMKNAIGETDLVVLPAVFGNGTGIKVIKKLEQLTGYQLCEIPTMPPSLLGIRLEDAMKSYYKSLGGLILAGDEVTHGEFENNQLQRIFTRHHGDMPLMANNYLLASGSFFSRGLHAERHHIEEAIFGLDIAPLISTNHQHWYQSQFFSEQPHQFLAMGVETNQHLQPSLNGNTITNLYCAGAILAHYNPIFEGSGSGVAISTGYHAALSMIALRDNYASSAIFPSLAEGNI
ncbi:glycerol-3-phosphate dehydrogenase [Photobacterium kishitanii]|uniref:Anaerobic glycerol-3-phosphate dehydrogenase subunit B n=3 Tax=Photobacterium kishitanii TaxID=318456 RepID=A0AAX0YRF0_9GAMM|nr:glycerol-3-phosphate dehydrogenase subunit GlpB [Photobacterium kishitanii]KJG55941.1 glycerol-3-phosphate dehydrogenase [Photobacterium kishitanii]KJG59164.1 glycerol-3-phosphate dehydrogenase [Photobacterium kishitanii]KJG68243.1 glycerol-3-phosphate dehydrogenase [Photobacterium kishitanii]PSX19454.1 glycerol-3-phosphate dehydrogenase subunit GlpB [Photobacterium kishitanii]PSX28793.1 glycerol-3-phosphate dehydrogenase subunit GlpB [Photobacterium kishitanii]